MQVPDSAAGKRTKCPKCAAIVSVPATPGSGAAGNPPPDRPPGQAGPKPAGPKAGGPTPQRPRPSQAPLQPQSPANRPAASNLQGRAPTGNARQVRCPRCQQVMRAAAGTTVQCPKCQATIKIPAPGSSRPSSSPGGFDFDDLPSPSSFGPSSPGPLGPSSFGPSSFGAAKPKSQASGPSFPSYSAPAGGNPYASGGATYASGGGRRRGGNLPSGRSGWHYAVPGAIFDILGALLILGVISHIGITIWLFASGRIGENMPMVLAQLAVAIAISAPIAVVYLMGGSAMIRRQGLGAAKAAAVVGCIPCFNCIVLTPIGIWAAILVFSDEARRDFSD